MCRVIKGRPRSSWARTDLNPIDTRDLHGITDRGNRGITAVKKIQNEVGYSRDTTVHDTEISMTREYMNIVKLSELDNVSNFCSRLLFVVSTIECSK